MALAGGRLSNEDLFNLRRLAEAPGRHRCPAFEAWPAASGCARSGWAAAANLGGVGKGDAILVVASDLHEEAPHLVAAGQAGAERGAALIVAQRRARPGWTPTPPTACATRTADEATALGLLDARDAKPGLASRRRRWQAAAEALAAARTPVIFFGAEGLDYGWNGRRWPQACAALLAATGHAGQANNGLVAVWPQANTQGAWDMGLSDPSRPRGERLASAEAV